MESNILSLDIENFKASIQKLASSCKSKEDVKNLESTLEQLSNDEYKGENREGYQKIIDCTLNQIDAMLGKYVLSRKCQVEETEEIKVFIENNAVVGFERIKDEG